MKKGSPVSKKPNKIKIKAKGPSKVLKQVKQLAQGLARAMSAKPAKKAQTKPAPKARKPGSAVPKTATKVASKPVTKPQVKATKPLPAAKKAPLKAETQKGKKPAAATPAKVAPGKVAPAKQTPAKTTPVPASGKKGKGEGQGVLPLPKVGSVVKPGKGAKSPKGSKPVIQVHNEKMCRETGCENPSTTKGYCRLDYIKNWKRIKRKEMILKEGKLNQYIEELVSKYPDKYIDVIRQDLSTEVNFNKVIHDLELDESMDDLDYDSDSIDSLIGSIRKEDDGFDDSDF